MVYIKLISFFKDLPKQNKILNVHVKDKSCNSPEGLQLYLKDTSTLVFSCEHSKNIQLPQQHLSFLQNLLNFIIKKYLKQEVDDNLSICMNKCSLCRLYITENIKIYQSIM